MRELSSTGKGAKWIVRRVRRIRASSGEEQRFAQFYDDAVAVIREGDKGAMGEAHVILATQVKSGDFSSQAIADQLVKDLEREVSGECSSMAVAIHGGTHRRAAR